MGGPGSGLSLPRQRCCVSLSGRQFPRPPNWEGAWNPGFFHKPYRKRPPWPTRLLAYKHTKGPRRRGNWMLPCADLAPCPAARLPGPGAGRCGVGWRDWAPGAFGRVRVPAQSPPPSPVTTSKLLRLSSLGFPTGNTRATVPSAGGWRCCGKCPARGGHGACPMPSEAAALGRSSAGTRRKASGVLSGDLS